MTRSHFLHGSGAALASALLASCSTPGPAGPPVSWPNRAFSQVRAFVYYCGADKSVHFFQEDGSLHAGILNPGGTLLTSAQVQRLMPALTTPTPRRHRTACYLPHHAFLFYNNRGDVVAHTEICFTCTIQRSSPEGLPEHINFQSVWDILGEAGVARGEGTAFYKALYRETRSAGAAR